MDEELNKIFWKLSCYPGTEGISATEAQKEVKALIDSYSKGVERRAYTDALYDSGYTPDYINAPISTKAVEKRLKAFKALGGKPEGKPNE